MRRLIEKPVNRLEAFSDAVFAVSATLLVVSLDVPESLPAMLGNLAGFAGFAFSFAVLVLIWVEHNRFFRRFGLQDPMTIFLNSVLLFVVLFFVYPLKFLSLALANWALGIGPQVINSWSELQQMFLIYGAGWTAVFLSFAALYAYAGRRCDPSAHADRLEARLTLWSCLINAGVGILSILVALTGMGLWFGLPGMIYGLLGPLHWWHETRADKKRAAIAGG